MSGTEDTARPLKPGPLPALRRMWRRRGFGVHSPFAFDFLQRVVRGYGHGYAYYAYPELDRLAAEAGMPAARMRMAYRAALFFRKCSLEIHAPGPQKETLERMVGKYAGRVQSSAERPEERIIIAVDEGVASEPVVSALASAPCGITFRGKRMLIHAGLSHLPRLTYDVWM